jgi:hypothetical protein
MEHFLRVFLVSGLIASVILIIAVGLARNDAYLAAPAHLILFLVGLAIYLLPAELAWRRDCCATVWIALVDMFLGWTVAGWVASLCWAVRGKVQTLTFPKAPERAQPLPEH